MICKFREDEYCLKILVTGSNGFIGKNLIAGLKNNGYNAIFEFDTNTEQQKLSEYCKSCDFVFHLAGVTRPKNQEDFMNGNFGFTSLLLDTLKKHNNKCPVMMSSSRQATLDNLYGKSKKAGEELLFNYSKETGAEVFIYRFTNIFGKWSKPNFSSVVATFCNNIANNLPIQINDPNTIMNLNYIDDVIEELINALKCNVTKDEEGFCFVNNVYTVKLGELADLIYSFKDTRETLGIPNLSNEFEKKLYSTYLSFLPTDKFSYSLKSNKSESGNLTEILKTTTSGQLSVNVIKPNKTRGNHWHNTKNEKFVVVSGQGLIRLRKVGTKEIFDYPIDDEKIEVVDIPPGYTHNISNLSTKDDLVTIIWANEPYNKDKPDTFFEKV